MSVLSPGLDTDEGGGKLSSMRDPAFRAFTSLTHFSVAVYIIYIYTKKKKKKKKKYIYIYIYIIFFIILYFYGIL